MKLLELLYEDVIDANDIFAKKRENDSSKRIQKLVDRQSADKDRYSKMLNTIEKNLENETNSFYMMLRPLYSDYGYKKDVSIIYILSIAIDKISDEIEAVNPFVHLCVDTFFKSDRYFNFRKSLVKALDEANKLKLKILNDNTVYDSEKLIHQCGLIKFIYDVSLFLDQFDHYEQNIARMTSKTSIESNG